MIGLLVAGFDVEQTQVDVLEHLVGVIRVEEPDVSRQVCTPISLAAWNTRETKAGCIMDSPPEKVIPPCVALNRSL